VAKKKNIICLGYACFIQYDALVQWLYLVVGKRCEHVSGYSHHLSGQHTGTLAKAHACFGKWFSSGRRPAALNNFLVTHAFLQDL
jgi:hypothetical protein